MGAYWRPLKEAAVKKIEAVPTTKRGPHADVPVQDVLIQKAERIIENE